VNERIAHNREEGGRLVRAAWISWAQQQPNPKPSWLVPWEDLAEEDKEADRVIWDQIALPYVQIIAEKDDRIDSLAERLDAVHEVILTGRISEE